MGLNKANAGTPRLSRNANFGLNLSLWLCFVLAYLFSLPLVHAIGFTTLEIQLPLPGEKGANTDLIMPAYITAPDSLGGLPLSAWLDTAQGIGIGEKVWNSKSLNPEERAFIKAFQALMRLDLMNAMLLHREGLKLPKQHKLYQTYAANACVLLLYVGERSEAEHRLRKIAQKSISGGEGAWSTKAARRDFFRHAVQYTQGGAHRSVPTRRDVSRREPRLPAIDERRLPSDRRAGRCRW